MLTGRSGAAGAFRIVLALMLVEVWGMPPRWAQAAGEPPRVAASDKDPVPASHLRQSLAALEALDQAMPRCTFDPQAVVAKVGKDPGKLFDWVRDNTSWVPYQGSLRGATGVLLDRVGNSLDRSLLLAELLRQAGHQARLARAKLDQATCEQLASQVRICSECKTLADWSPAQARKDCEATARLFGLDDKQALANLDAGDLNRARATEDMLARTAEQAAMLAAALGAPAQAASPDAKLVQESLADHWWVQCQQQGKWVDMDVLPPQAAAGQSQAKAATTLVPDAKTGAFKLDPALCHRVAIRVIVERWDAGKLQTQTALSAEVYAADAIGQPIYIQSIPQKWPKDLALNSGADPAAIKQALLSQADWLPVIAVGRNVSIEQAFSDDGHLYTYSRFFDVGSVGQKASGLTGGLGGMLGGDDGPAKGGVLSAQWIEYEFRRPGAPATKIRREVFDLVGPAARAAQVPKRLEVSEEQRIERCMKLIGAIRVLPQCCRLSPEFLSHLFARDMQTLKIAIQPGGGFDPAQTTRLAMQSVLPDGPMYHWATLRWEGNPLSESAYLDRLNMANLRNEVWLDAGGRLRAGLRMDVVANEIAVCPAAAQRAFEARFLQGIADTVAENIALDMPAAFENTTGLMSAATAESRAPLVVRSPSQADFKDLKIEPDVRARIEQDIAAGNAVVVAAVTDSYGNTHAGWWRVNAATGQTLGIMDNGFNSSATETAITKVLIAVGAAAIVLIYAAYTIWGNSPAVASAPGTAMSRALGGSENVYEMTPLSPGKGKKGSGGSRGSGGVQADRPSLRDILNRKNYEQ